MKLKTKREVLKNYPEYKRLINACIQNVGEESIGDIINDGASRGYVGFIYYHDTVAFFNKHKKDIINLAKEMAFAIGEDTLQMIKQFNCLKNYNFSSMEISEALYIRGNENETIVKNAMAWFALEDVCRMFEE